MAFTPIAPNCQRIVAALASEYPQEFKDCHRPELGSRAYDFIRRVAYVLHSTVDVRFGLNGKRGNTNDPSMDAVSFRNPASAAGGVEVIDVVGGAGAAGASPVWNDVTQSTINAGTVGAYIQPQPVGGSKPTDPVDPKPDPTPDTPCACNVTGDEMEAVLAMVAELAAQQQARATRTEDLARTLVEHLDDVKQRIERVSQELANKPAGSCRLPRW